MSFFRASTGLFGLIASIAFAVAASPVWGPSHKLEFVLRDELHHPLYWWPRTLLSYPVQFEESVDLSKLALRDETGHPIALQWSDISRSGGRITQATLNFFSDLPSGELKRFVLSEGSAATESAAVIETNEAQAIVLDAGAIRVRIPATQSLNGPAPGPVLALSRGGAPSSQWFGQSILEIPGVHFTHLEAHRIDSGPLFVTYQIIYTGDSGARYSATVRCVQGLDFVRVHEDMEGLPEAARGTWKFSWTGLPVSFRQSSNHPYPFPTAIAPYDDYHWEPVTQKQTNTHLGVQPGIKDSGELPFMLGVYEPWWAFTTSSFANFWSKESADAAGIFIDRPENWQDHEYAIWHASPKLQVHFFYRDSTLTFQYPLARGSRSTCLTLYDHARDVEAMHQLEQSVRGVKGADGFTYKTHLSPTSHVLVLQNRYGTIDLNRVKDWILSSPATKEPVPIFSTGMIASAAELERRVFTSSPVCELPVTGTRQNSGFGPVASREILDWWVDGFDRFRSQFSAEQRQRLTAMYLFMAYVHAGEDFMPMIPMLSGHPNFLSDAKSVPPAMSYLFPWHPEAKNWADEYQKFVELNTHNHTRPDVPAWDARGGRWTENLGTYVWAFLRPALRADFLLKKFDSGERFVTTQLAEMGGWLVDALSAPFDGESPAIVSAPGFERDTHEWGVVMPGTGPRRVYPPMGAHSERRIPPRALWYLGKTLQRYDPLTAEHLMWAARPTDQDMETPRTRPDPWKILFEGPDNRGTNPHLTSSKYTGFGITLRAAVDTQDEISIHLQQIDDGPNYRWGNAGQGGNGVLYFYAGGKSYSYNGREDVGDRDDQDTDFCTNFGVYKQGQFRSIGRNVLSRPMYDLGLAQFAELLSDSYSSPEYVSRSVLLAGHDYFALYDDVFNESVSHRLSWFVRKGEELPFIQRVKGLARGVETQRTKIETNEVSGVWLDGKGDSMAIVSQRKDLTASAAPFGATVTGPQVNDFVFENPEGIHYEQGGILFEGTIGIVRQSGAPEFALFHGTRIGVAGLRIHTGTKDLGISGRKEGSTWAGEYYTLLDTSCSFDTGITGASLYIDGEKAGVVSNGVVEARLRKGRHHWEITAAEPVPISPSILRTENFKDGATVFVRLVASATRYELQTSTDGGTTWSSAGESPSGTITLRTVGTNKVHVRAIAKNTNHSSVPGPEYPIYPSADPPSPPDGLRVKLSSNTAVVSWGQVLGAGKYKLYVRQKGAANFQVAYEGPDHQYIGTFSGVVEFQVRSVNGNGEGPASSSVTTDPASWLNFDPQGTEPFRRTSVRTHGVNDYYP